MTSILKHMVFPALVLALLVECGGFYHNANNQISKVMNLDFMDWKLGKNEIDLPAGANCPGGLALKVVNAEQGTQNHIFFTVAGHKHYVVPKEFMNLAARHLEEILKADKATIDSSAGHEIRVSFVDAQAEGTWSFLSNVKLRIEVPEIGYSQIYTGSEGSADAYHAIAFGAHLASIQFANDPVFHNYIRCRSDR